MGPLVYGVDEDGCFWLEGTAGKLWRLARDGYCVYCGTEMIHGAREQHPKQKTKDHVVPISKGGARGFDNVAPSCFPCNNEKAAERLLNYLLRNPIGVAPESRKKREQRKSRRVERREKRQRRRMRRLEGFKGDQLGRALQYHQDRLLKILRVVLDRRQKAS